MTEPQDRSSVLRAGRGLRRHLNARNVSAILSISIAVGCGSLLVDRMTLLVSEDVTPGVDTAIALLGIKVLTYVLAPLGGVGVKVLAGSMLGWQSASLIIIAGDTIGSSINYYLGKYGIRLFRSKPTPHPSCKIGRWSLDTTISLILARFVLSPAWDLISYALGARGIKFKRFFLASLLGGVPASIIWSIIGDSAASLLGRTAAVVIAVGSVLAGLIVASAYRSLRAR